MRCRTRTPCADGLACGASRATPREIPWSSARSAVIRSPQLYMAPDNVELPPAASTPRGDTHEATAVPDRHRCGVGRLGRAGGGAGQEGARPDGLGLPELHRPARTDADPAGRADTHPQRGQHRREGLRARRAGAGQPVPRRGGQRLARHGLDGVGLLDRQGHRLCDVRLGAVRPRRRRIPGVDEARRRREADEGAARQVQRRGHDLRRDLARGLGLVPQGDQDAGRPEGPEDALLRPRRQRDAEARRVAPSCCRPARSSRRCSSAPSTPPSSRCR